jgi:hypothetical protein
MLNTLDVMILPGDLQLEICTNIPEGIDQDSNTCLLPKALCNMQTRKKRRISLVTFHDN